MASQRKVAECWALLCAAYPSFKPSTETAQVYARFMGESQGNCKPGDEDACLELAVLRCIKTIKFFPSVAELLEARENAPYQVAANRGRIRQAQELKLLEAQAGEAEA